MAAVDLFMQLHQPVSTIMHREVVSVPEELAASEAARLLIERDISGLPVVDDALHPIGMFTRTDLVRDSVEGGGDDDATVGDLMTPLAFSLPETASITQAAALMWFEHIHRLPVVSPENQVVGIVTPMDVLRFLAELDGYRKQIGLPKP